MVNRISFVFVFCACWIVACCWRFVLFGDLTIEVRGSGVGLFGALLRVEGSSTAQLHNNQPSGVPRGQRSQEDTAPLLRNHNQDDDGDKNKNKNKSMTTTQQQQQNEEEEEDYDNEDEEHEPYFNTQGLRHKMLPFFDPEFKSASPFLFAFSVVLEAGAAVSCLVFKDGLPFLVGVASGLQSSASWILMRNPCRVF